MGILNNSILSLKLFTCGFIPLGSAFIQFNQKVRLFTQHFSGIKDSFVTVAQWLIPD